MYGREDFHGPRQDAFTRHRYLVNSLEGQFYEVDTKANVQIRRVLSWLDNIKSSVQKEETYDSYHTPVSVT